MTRQLVCLLGAVACLLGYGPDAKAGGGPPGGAETFLSPISVILSAASTATAIGNLNDLRTPEKASYGWVSSGLVFGSLTLLTGVPSLILFARRDDLNARFKDMMLGLSSYAVAQGVAALVSASLNVELSRRTRRDRVVPYAGLGRDGASVVGLAWVGEF